MTIPGVCVDIDGGYWKGHGPGSGCEHCDPMCPDGGCVLPRGHDGPHYDPSATSDGFNGGELDGPNF